MDALQKTGLKWAFEKLNEAGGLLGHAIARDGTAPGIAFTRAAIALALAKRAGEDPVNFAGYRWGINNTVTQILKADVPGAGLSSWSALADAKHVAIEFLELVRPMTILGRLQGLRMVPMQLPFAAIADGAIGTWTGEGRAAKVSRAAFTRDRLDRKKITALTVQSNELMQANSPESELLVRNDLARAVAQAMDFAFVDMSNEGDEQTPASITAEFQSGSESTGDVEQDVQLALSGFGGNLMTSSWLINPTTAAIIGLRAGGKGVAADLGALGGTLAGLPVVTSEAVDAEHLILVDAGSVCLADEGAEPSASSVATIELTDAPEAYGLSPLDSANVNMVSLFQSDMTALKISRYLNWKLARANAVSCITGIDYLAASE